MRGAVLNLACVVELPSTRSNSGAARIRRRPTRLLFYPAKNLLIGASVRNLVELLRPLSAGEKAAILAQAVHEGIRRPSGSIRPRTCAPRPTAFQIITAEGSENAASR